MSSLNVESDGERDTHDLPPNSLLGETSGPAVIGEGPSFAENNPRKQQSSSPHFCRKVSEMEESSSCNESQALATFMEATRVQEEPKSPIQIELETFLLFIKIMFKLLEDDPTVRQRAQRIVLECRRQSQRGNPSFQPLMRGVECHLRRFVGEARWRRAHLLLHYYLQKNGQDTTPRAQQQLQHQRKLISAVGS